MKKGLLFDIFKQVSLRKHIQSKFILLGLVLAMSIFKSYEMDAQNILEVKDAFASAMLVADSNKFDYRKAMYSLKSDNGQSKVVKAKTTDNTASAKDSAIHYYTRIRVVCSVNSPDLIARMNIMIGENINTYEVFSGFATVENHNGVYYCTFNEDVFRIERGKLTFYWFGSKEDLERAKFVTIQSQSFDGKLSNFTFAKVKLID